MKVPAVFNTEVNEWWVSIDSLIASDVSRLKTALVWKPVHPLNFAFAQMKFETQELEFEIVPLDIEWRSVMLNGIANQFGRIRREHWGWCKQKSCLVICRWEDGRDDEEKYIFLQPSQYRLSKWKRLLENGISDYGNEAVRLYDPYAWTEAERLVNAYTQIRKNLWKLFDNKEGES